jgi:mRNA interferase MazF
VSVDELSTGEASELIAVVPLSSSRAQSALRPEVSCGEGVDHPSRAICRGVRAVARSRLLHKEGAVKVETLAEIERALGWVLGLEVSGEG